MRTWKMEGPPEIVDGMVMNVMTSCSLRPASRARKPPMAWMPSCELPAMRMTTSLMEETFFAPSDEAAPVIVSLMELKNWLTALQKWGWRLKTDSMTPLPFYSRQAERLCQFLMLTL